MGADNRVEEYTPLAVAYFERREAAGRALELLDATGRVYRDPILGPVAVGDWRPVWEDVYSGPRSTARAGYTDTLTPELRSAFRAIDHSAARHEYSDIRAREGIALVHRYDRATSAYSVERVPLDVWRAERGITPPPPRGGANAAPLSTPL